MEAFHMRCVRHRQWIGLYEHFNPNFYYDFADALRLSAKADWANVADCMDGRMLLAGYGNSANFGSDNRFARARYGQSTSRRGNEGRTG